MACPEAIDAALEQPSDYPSGVFPRLPIADLLERRWLHYAFLTADGSRALIANIAWLGGDGGTPPMRTAILLAHDADHGWSSSRSTPDRSTQTQYAVRLNRGCASPRAGSLRQSPACSCARVAEGVDNANRGGRKYLLSFRVGTNRHEHASGTRHCCMQAVHVTIGSVVSVSDLIESDSTRQ